MHKKPALLIILDGFGNGTRGPYNAVSQACTPFLDFAYTKYPSTSLVASGSAVGLPEGVVGNSQVGHITIGAGERITQPLTIINTAIATGALAAHPLLQADLEHVVATGKKLHIMGLLSDGNVHGSIGQFFGYIHAASIHPIKEIILHPFLDGRDTPAKSAATYLQLLQTYINDMPQITIGSITGRFYAMDRDTNWQRTKRCYAMLTNQASQQISWKEAIAHYYATGITDEFIPPTALIKNHIINDGDGIIFTNCRPERARQLTSCFIQKECNPCTSTPLSLAFFITPISYAEDLPSHALYKQMNPKTTLMHELQKRGLHILSIAETEKYAHVTYFFNGGNETAYTNERRILIPSIKTERWQDYPCMSAPEITTTIIESLEHDPCDFYLINYANADMIGHTGDVAATKAAIECLDKQLEKLYQVAVKQMNGTMYITADHGKAERVDQQHTAHTTGTVPFLYINQKTSPDQQLPLHELADIAPFILKTLES